MELWHTDYSEVVTKMIGRHQAENLKTALATIEVLRQNRDIQIERSQLYAGLREAAQPGRFEVMARPESEWNAFVVLDGAHNDPGAEALQQTMADVFPDKKTLIVAGMVEKKETDKVLAHFAKVSRDFIATQPDYERRAMAAETFAQFIRETKDPNGMPLHILEVCGSPEEAVEAAHRHAAEGGYEVILFTGSLYLIGAIRSILTKRTDYDHYRTLKYGDGSKHD